MKYYIISGETSGDQHAARVIEKIQGLDKDAAFRGMGGDQCASTSMELVVHNKEMAFMGIGEVVKNLKTISSTLKKIKSDILSFKPNVVLLVDYPGFNFKIAKFAHQNNIPVHYYIAPKAWAWKKSRIKLLKKYVNQVHSILPFEEAFFNQHGLQVNYVGNPSKEAIEEKMFTQQIGEHIAVLPGSRAQEIKLCFPLMLQAIKELNLDEGKKILIAQAPGFDANFYEQIANPYAVNLELIEGDMHALLSQSKIALVTSGTATLETALMNVPQVVCYKTSAFNYFIGKMFVKLEFISLVNLILNKEAVTELLQGDFNIKKLKEEVSLLLTDQNRIEAMRKDYALLRTELKNIKPSLLVAQALVEEAKS